ncbi:MAG: hypothetical protein ABJG68_17525 [Crocinitomicaceae bacterium]
MKKFLGLATGLLLTVFTMAHHGVAFNDASSDYDKAATTEFNFTMDSNFSLDDINSTAAFYTDYFTVTTAENGEGHTVTFTLAQDDEMSRRVITRFFVSLEVTEIDVNGEHMEVNHFVMTYIMKG